MALPTTIRVKLSSEDAGSITITPVVRQELALRELVEHMLGASGKDELRLCEILRRGTFITGGSRFRWEGFETALEDLRPLLASFPDPDPARPFRADACTRVRLFCLHRSVDLDRDAARRTGWRQRSSYWDALVAAAAQLPPLYDTYSYRERADRYTQQLDSAAATGLSEAAARLTFANLRQYLGATPVTSIEWLQPR